MSQLNFDFGPAHNVRNPATETSSSSSIDDLISKLGSMLSLSSKNNENLATILKNAVKEGIEEAHKADDRTIDSEERTAERQHKELIHELRRIAGLSANSGGHLTSKPEEKKEDGASLKDIIKWGSILTGALVLGENLNLLGDTFTKASKFISSFSKDMDGYVTDTENFSNRLGNLVDNAFTKEGAIGLLIGAFSPGGILAKTVLGFLGMVTGGEVGKKLKEYGISADDVSMGGVAGGLAAMKMGGPWQARVIEGIVGYTLGDRVGSQLTGEKSSVEKMTEAGSKMVQDISSSVSNISIPSVSNSPTDKAYLLTQEIEKTKKLKEENKRTIDGKLYSPTEYETAWNALSMSDKHRVTAEEKLKRKELEKKIEELEAKKEQHIQEEKDRLDPYGAKLREYDKKIEALKTATTSIGIGGTTISMGAYNKLSSEEQEKLSAQIVLQRKELKTQIAQTEADKENFIKTTNDNKISQINTLITNSNVPINEKAGEADYFTKSAAISAGIGFSVGMFASPLGAVAGAVGGFAMDAATELFVTTIERYMQNDLKTPKIKFADLVKSNPNAAIEILKNYYNDYPMQALSLVVMLSGATLAPTSLGKTILGLLKNIPKLGTVVAEQAGKGAVQLGVNTVAHTAQISTFLNPVAGLGKSSLNVALAGLGGGSAAAIALRSTKDSPLMSPIFYDRQNNSPLPNNPVNNDNVPSNSPLPNNPIVNMTNSELRRIAHADHRTLKEGKFVDDGLTTVITTKSGKKFEVASNRAKQFKGFVDDLEATGYDISSIHGLDNRFNSSLSNSTHNLGISIDINPSTNKQATKTGGKLITDMNPNVVRALAAKHGLEWGGDYQRPDAMHFAIDKAQRLPNENQDDIRSSIFAKRAMGLSGLSFPMGDLIGQILRTESHGNANSFWGDKTGKYDSLRKGKQIVNMTFTELKEFQKALTAKTKGTLPDTDEGTSAVGLGQWVGTTLFGKNYDDTGFLKEYYGNKNYDNEVFSEETQKDMFKKFLLSKNYGNLSGFLSGNMSSEEYAKKLGKQWQGVSKPEEQQLLVATLDKLKKSPHANIEKELDSLMTQMDSLVTASDKFNNTMQNVGKSVRDGFTTLGNFFKNVVEEAPKLLPDEFKALFDVPEMLDFIEPLVGGQSRSTLAHPTRTLDKADINKVKSLILGKSVEEIEARDSAKLNNVESYPLVNGSQLLYDSQRISNKKEQVNNENLGNIISMSSNPHPSEQSKGTMFSTESGHIDTKFPGDVDAIAAKIYPWTDAAMFYASGY